MPVETAAAIDRGACPRFIRSGDRSLFIWHHPPAPERRRGAAVILCPAIGYEYMSAYRTWRLMAESLARLGFDAVRLDYDGTGNSEGGPEEPGRLQAWRQSVVDAIAEARRLCRSDRVALIGLRAGALVAVDAAAASGCVDRLVLWNPFASGRGYVRELRAMATLHELGEDADGPAINAEGHLLTAETVGALAGWTLEGLPVRPAPEILIVDRDDRRSDAEVAAALTGLGARVERLTVAGTADMLAPPHLSSVPRDAVDAIVGWLDGWRPASPCAPGRERAPARTPARDAKPYREHCVRFGPEDRLFGILSMPAQDRFRRPFDCAQGRPAVILLNTGAGHHVGPHRLYVPLAREWAANGHVVLRFDLGGIGDSQAPPGGTAGDAAYPTHMLEDAREAIACVRRHAPASPVIVAGLCSGAWLAFEAARRGLAVDAVVAINPPLYLRDGGRQWLKEQREADRHRRSLQDPSRWISAIRRGTAAAAAARIAARAGRTAAGNLGTLLRSDMPEGLAGDLHAIARRGIATLFVFGDADNGKRYFDQHARPALRRVDVSRVIRQVVVDNADHAFRRLRAQRELRSILNDFVSSLAPIEPPRDS